FGNRVIGCSQWTQSITKLPDYPITKFYLQQYVFHEKPCVRGAMAFGAAHALPALLLEDPDLGAARLAFDNRKDASVLDKRGAGQNLAAVLFDEQDLAERE